MRARPPLAVALALLTSLGAIACNSEPKANPTAFAYAPCTPNGFTSVGETLPDCTFEGFPGTPALRLADLKGKPIVLNFWASWCINCIAEMPDFQDVYESLGGKVAFVGMNVTGLQGETEAAGQSFAKAKGVRYLLAYDTDGLLYSHFSPSVERPVMPITVFVGPDLRVMERHFGGPISAKRLRDDIRKYFDIS
jgi:thiol-disulfide isomerase/thioredoxin